MKNEKVEERTRLRNGFPNPQFFIFHFAFFIFLLLIPAAAFALHFPDTTQILQEFKLSARAQGKPVGFYRIADGDSAALTLEWQGNLPVTARYDQGREFGDEAFTRLQEAYGAGGAWHEYAEALPAAQKILPGLQQQWMLKGYGGERGWLGSGVYRGRYFLAFREHAPVEMAPVTAPLKLGAGFLAYLDTSSQWLHVPCKPAARGNSEVTSGKAQAKPLCFSPVDDSRLSVRVDRRNPPALEIRLQEEESESLRQIRTVVQTVPDAAQHDYALDLSQMLLGEAQIFLVKLAQRAPGLFNWPSWQLQDLKQGQVPERTYLDIVRSERAPGDSLPALRYDAKGLKLSVDLYYNGLLRMQAEEKPGS